MSEIETTAAPQPVIREEVATTAEGKETTTYENDIRVRVRIDYDEWVNAHASSRTTHYDASGSEFAHDEVYRNGTTWSLTRSSLDDAGVRTHTIVETDPENVDRWTGIRTVERYGPESHPGSGFLGRYRTQINDDGSSWKETRDANFDTVSRSDTEINGVTTALEYENSVVVNETVLDPGNAQGFVSKASALKNGNVTTQTFGYIDGTNVTTEYADGTATTRTTIDGGGLRSWASHVVTLDADGKPVTGTTVNDDGSTATTTYTGGIRSKAVIDLDGANGDLGSVLTFDGTGALKQRVATAANGLLTTREFSAGSVMDKVIDDAGDAFIWARHTAAFDGQGQRTSALTTYDNSDSITTEFTNGIRSRQVIDRAGASAIDSERTFDATGALSWTEWTTAKDVFVVTNYADGRATMRIARDIADVFEFDTHIQSYLDGKVSVAVTAFDAGLVRTVIYDDGVPTARSFRDGRDDFPWQSRSFALDDRGGVAGTHTVWDDASATDTGSFL